MSKESVMKLFASLMTPDRFDAKLVAALVPPDHLNAKLQQPMSKTQSNYLENDPSAPSHILNRPFYKIEKTEPLALTWDGEIGGRECLVVPYDDTTAYYFVKISDAIPSLEELNAGTVTLDLNAEDYVEGEELFPLSLTLGELEMLNMSEDGFPAYAFAYEGLPCVISAYDDGSVYGVSLTAGIYVSALIAEDATIYVSSLDFPSVDMSEIKKLDNEFIDAEWTAHITPTTVEILPVEERENGSWYNNLTIPKYIKSATVTYNGQVYERAVSNYNEVYFVGNLSLLDSSKYPDNGDPFLAIFLASEGLVAFRGDVETAMFGMSVTYEKFERLPDKFLPDGTVYFDYANWDDSMAKDVAGAYLAGKNVMVEGVPQAHGGAVMVLSVMGYDIYGDMLRIAFADANGAIFAACPGSKIICVLDLGIVPSNFSENCVLFGNVIQTEGYGKSVCFTPTSLNETLKKDSKLPAQEGAVYTALQNAVAECEKKTRIVAYNGTLATNTIYTANLSGDVKFVLPSVADATCENRIRIMASVAEGTTFDWGTTHYYGASIPYCPSGYFEIVFDYNPLINAWVAGATRIGEVSAS